MTTIWNLNMFWNEEKTHILLYWNARDIDWHVLAHIPSVVMDATDGAGMCRRNWYSRSNAIWDSNYKKTKKHSSIVLHCPELNEYSIENWSISKFPMRLLNHYIKHKPYTIHRQLYLALPCTFVRVADMAYFRIHLMHCQPALRMLFSIQYNANCDYSNRWSSCIGQQQRMCSTALLRFVIESHHRRQIQLVCIIGIFTTCILYTRIHCESSETENRSVHSDRQEKHFHRIASSFTQATGSMTGINSSTRQASATYTATYPHINCKSIW